MKWLNVETRTADTDTEVPEYIFHGKALRFPRRFPAYLTVPVGARAEGKKHTSRGSKLQASGTSRLRRDLLPARVDLPLFAQATLPLVDSRSSRERANAGWTWREKERVVVVWCWPPSRAAITGRRDPPDYAVNGTPWGPRTAPKRPPNRPAVHPHSTPLRPSPPPVLQS